MFHIWKDIVSECIGTVFFLVRTENLTCTGKCTLCQHEFNSTYLGLTVVSMPHVISVCDCSVMHVTQAGYLSTKQFKCKGFTARVHYLSDHVKNLSKSTILIYIFSWVCLILVSQKQTVSFITKYVG